MYWIFIQSQGDVGNLVGKSVDVDEHNIALTNLSKETQLVERPRAATLCRR
jgi:hypothetical protein